MSAPTMQRGDVLAHLDAMTGVGWLMLPARLASDAVHAFTDATVGRLLMELDRLGWEVLDNETGDGPMTDGWCPDGRVAVALSSECAVIESPSFEQICEATKAIAVEAGIWL